MPWSDNSEKLALVGYDDRPGRIVGLQQGEEFFTGLCRQNKRARFIRYFGEGHVVEGPGTVKDMWLQIFS